MAGLCLFPLHKLFDILLLRTGVGPDLHWISLPSGAPLLRFRAFAAARIYGIEPSFDGWVPRSAGDDGRALQVAAHGGCHVVIVGLQYDAETRGGRLHWALPPQPQYVLCTRFLAGDVLAGLLLQSLGNSDSQALQLARCLTLEAPAYAPILLLSFFS